MLVKNEFFKLELNPELLFDIKIIFVGIYYD